jgi:peptide/nickel transport system permease protein
VGDRAAVVTARVETVRPVRRALVRLVPALVMMAVAAAGPAVAPHAVDVPVTAPYGPPGAGALLGGDQLGRDVLSRLLAGGRDLMVMALVITVAVTTLAAVLGVLAALRPRVGRLIERTVDLLMLVPVVLALLLVVLAWPGGDEAALVVVAIVMGTPYAVRVVAGAAAPVAASGFVETAAAGGERLWYLVAREVLPNLRWTLLALLGLRFVEAVYVVSTAGFLQIGPQPPAAHWALMVRENAAGVLLNPWAVVAPSLAIGLMALSVNLAAETLVPRVGDRAGSPL